MLHLGISGITAIICISYHAIKRLIYQCNRFPHTAFFANKGFRIVLERKQMTQGQRRAQDFPHKRVAKNVEGSASRINQFVLPKKRYLTNTVGNAPLKCWKEGGAPWPPLCMPLSKEMLRNIHLCALYIYNILSNDACGRVNDFFLFPFSDEVPVWRVLGVLVDPLRHLFLPAVLRQNNQSLLISLAWN